MIHIKKDKDKIPVSLNSDLTHKRRLEVINAGKYLSGSAYNSRYKKEDIKTELKNIYRSKCAFCEQKIERFDVEHFRPKSIYYWLAFSWDNLLVACPVCNGNKTNHFEVLKERAVYNDEDYISIHKLGKKYDKIEKNLFYNPESEDPEPNLIYDKTGFIYSENEKLNYTIQTCKLNRPYLIERRKKIMDLFEKRQKEMYLLYLFSKDKKYLYRIKALREVFKLEAFDLDNEFVAFRKFMYRTFILSDK